MIIYESIWQTLKKRHISTYSLINDHHMSSSTLDRLRKNLPLTTVTLNDLCRILNCELPDIAEYIPSDNRSKTIIFVIIYRRHYDIK